MIIKIYEDLLFVFILVAICDVKEGFLKKFLEPQENICIKN
jgi:hypothetical protein